MVLIRNFHGKWPSARTIWVRFSDKIPAEIRITLIYNMFPISVLGSFGNFHAMWFAWWPTARPPPYCHSTHLYGRIHSDSLGYQCPPAGSLRAPPTHFRFPSSSICSFPERARPRALQRDLQTKRISVRISASCPIFFGCSVFWLRIVFGFLLLSFVFGSRLPTIVTEPRKKRA